MKKLLVLLVSCFLFIPNVYAVHIEVRERTGHNNFGVNKSIDMNNVNKSDLKSTPYVVNPKLNVYDFGNLLTESEELYIRSQAKTLEARTNWSVVIYTISDEYAYEHERETLMGKNFYDFNDFGINNGKYYNGVILVMNKLPNGDPSTKGYYDVIAIGEAQYYFDDARFNRMLDGMETEFWSGKYQDASLDFLEYVGDFYSAGKFESDGSWYLDENGFIKYRPSVPYIFIFAIAIGASALVTSYYVKKNKMVKKAYNATQYIDVNDRAFSRRQDDFKYSRTSSYRITSSSSSGGSGGGRISGSFGGSSGRGGSSGGGRRR